MPLSSRNAGQGHFCVLAQTVLGRHCLDVELVDSIVTVDHARDAGVRIGAEAAGRLEASAAAHELSLPLTVPVATIETQLACARRIGSMLPSVWAAWKRGEISTLKATKIDQAATRLTRPQSRVALDELVVDIAWRKTAGQLKVWLDRLVERLEADSASKRHERAQGDRSVWFASAFCATSTIRPPTARRQVEDPRPPPILDRCTGGRTV